MAQKSLRRCDLDEAIVVKLESKEMFTVQDVILKDELTLYEILDQPLPAIRQLLYKVSTYVVPQSQTVHEMAVSSNNQFLATDVYELDKELHGGVPCDAITEVIGSPGLGKTQFCHTLTVMNHYLKGGRTVYIDTENAFSVERLMEIAKHKFAHHYGRPDTTEEALKDLTENVTLLTPADTVELLQQLQELEYFIITKKVTLVVLDSIAAIIKREFGGRQNLPARQDLLAKEAGKLKFIAEQFHIPVIVTNHLAPMMNRNPATYDFNQGNTAAQALSAAFETSVVAALGNTWAHCVNIRFALDERREIEHNNELTRFITIVKSPTSANLAIPYRILKAGFTMHPDAAVRMGRKSTVTTALPQRDTNQAFQNPQLQHTFTMSAQHPQQAGNAQQFNPPHQPHNQQTPSTSTTSTTNNTWNSSNQQSRVTYFNGGRRT
eukprot:TRINITY_DN55472_c0_g1_i1.p1 TRINITY_DN55472_c0_g1~~TRINITY_DN55472_c0_g1_i1.p1  ORF type:complete len:436 (+),score=44.99 TRINITY_DN55472_c0_g1_i1:28-1335(+)